MIAITRKEKDVIAEKLPKVHIVRTMKHDSKRKHYFCEETRQVKALLKKMHEGS